MNAKKNKFICSLSHKTNLNPIIINRLYVKKTLIIIKEVIMESTVKIFNS